MSAGQIMLLPLLRDLSNDTTQASSSAWMPISAIAFAESKLLRSAMSISGHVLDRFAWSVFERFTEVNVASPSLPVLQDILPEVPGTAIRRLDQIFVICVSSIMVDSQVMTTEIPSLRRLISNARSKATDHQSKVIPARYAGPCRDQRVMMGDKRTRSRTAGITCIIGVSSSIKPRFTMNWRMPERICERTLKVLRDSSLEMRSR